MLAVVEDRQFMSCPQYTRAIYSSFPCIWRLLSKHTLIFSSPDSVILILSYISYIMFWELTKVTSIAVLWTLYTNILVTMWCPKLDPALQWKASQFWMEYKQWLALLAYRTPLNRLLYVPSIFCNNIILVINYKPFFFCGSAAYLVIPCFVVVHFIVPS